jgi:hypothetical protein
MTQSFRTATAAAVAMGLGLLIACPAQSATQAQFDEAWRKGIWWLFFNQSGDGFWKSTEGTQVAATALAVEAPNNAPLKSYPFFIRALPCWAMCVPAAPI